MPDYEFLKRFCEESNEGDTCEICIVSVVKCKKGTTKSPSPYYDRSESIEDEEDRYRLCSMKKFSFVYGKKYESVVEEGHVFESQKEGYIQKKETPDMDCRMLSRNLTTGKYCVDIVGPEFISKQYYSRTLDEYGQEQLSIVTTEELHEQVYPWLSASKHDSEPPLFMQFSLSSVFSVKNITTGKNYININNKFSNQSVLCD